MPVPMCFPALATVSFKDGQHILRAYVPCLTSIEPEALSFEPEQV